MALAPGTVTAGLPAAQPANEDTAPDDLLERRQAIDSAAPPDE